MWRAILWVCAIGSTVHDVAALSFFSHVFFRMLFPKPQPQAPKIVAPVPQLTGSKSFKDEMTVQMASGASPEQMVETLVYTLIGTSRGIVPDEFELPNSTYALPLGGKLELRLGKVSGIRSYGEPAIQSTVDESGHMEFVVHLQFANLVATYDSMFLDYKGRLFDKRGKGTFRILKNKFIAKLRVVRASDIFVKLTKEECVVFVRSIKAVELSDIAVDIYNERKKRAFYTSAIVDVVITSLQEMLQEELTIALAEELWDMLSDSKGFFCRDTGLFDVVNLIKKRQSQTNTGEKKSDQTSSTQNLAPNRPASAETKLETKPEEKKPEENTSWFAPLINWWNGSPKPKEAPPVKEGAAV